MSKNLTIHIIASVPYSNLNRDEAGVPKQINQGGAVRAIHSSQSIKRGIRTLYEDASLDTSVRSGKLAEDIVEAAKKLNAGLDEKEAGKQAKALLGKLTKATASEGESDRSIWMSQEEIDTAAAVIAGQKAEETEFIRSGKTGSLAIAAFGRMFANDPTASTEAAIAVSPGVTTHEAIINTDYFSTVDDIRERHHDTGATFLGVGQYTSGVFYRTITIDRDQLRQSWTGFDSEKSDDNLRALVDATLYGLPSGKKNSTAPYIQPALALAEEQRYRAAYDFETPVETNEGGYLNPTLDRFAQLFNQARRFDPDNFGPVEILTGTSEKLDGLFEGIQPVSKKDFINAVVAWIKADN